jgi:hypothetical protein
VRRRLARRALQRNLVGAEPDKNAERKQWQIELGQVVDVPVRQHRAVQFADLRGEIQKCGEQDADGSDPFCVAKQGR